MHRRGGDFTGRRHTGHTGMRLWRSSGPSLPPVAAGPTRSRRRACQRNGGWADTRQGTCGIDRDAGGEPVSGCTKAQLGQFGPGLRTATR